MILLLLQYKLWFKDDGVLGVIKMQRLVNAQQQELYSLQERNIKLSESVQLIKQDHQAIEEHVRVTFGMVKPGETYYRVIEVEH